MRIALSLAILLLSNLAAAELCGSRLEHAAVLGNAYSSNISVGGTIELYGYDNPQKVFVCFEETTICTYIVAVFPQSGQKVTGVHALRLKDSSCKLNPSN